MTFHVMFHYTLSTLWVAEWPPFGKVSEYQISQGIFEKLIKNHRKVREFENVLSKKNFILNRLP